MKKAYLFLSVAGLALPFYFLFQFISASGINVSLLLNDLFSNSASAFFVMDVIVASIVFWVYIVVESHRLKMKYVWIYILANLTIGLSFALPLFLYFRQAQVEQAEQT